MALFSKGITLAQHKEPAFSSILTPFVSPQNYSLNLKKPLPRVPGELSPKDILTLAKEAQIYDEGDGRLLVSKLRRIEGKGTRIIIDAIDDEPYVSSKMSPLIQQSIMVSVGIRLCTIVADSSDVVVRVYRHMGDTHSGVPSRVGEYPVERVGGGYPALPSSKSLMRNSRGEDLIIGVGAVIHLARAATQQIPQTTTFVTVAGNCIANPMNLEVSLGMNFQEIIERCGLVRTPTRVIRGGAMRGIAIEDRERTLVTPTTRAILALRDETSGRTYDCIQCGRCETYCPVGLNPAYIHRFVDRKHYGQMEKFDAHYCIGCGTCSYVCPSRLDLVSTMKQARNYAAIRYNKKGEQEDEDER